MYLVVTNEIADFPRTFRCYCHIQPNKGKLVKKIVTPSPSKTDSIRTAMPLVQDFQRYRTL